MIRPRKLTLYILSELGIATLIGIAVWTAILIMNDFFFIARTAIQKDLGAVLVLQILTLRTPSFLVLAIPIVIASRNAIRASNDPTSVPVGPSCSPGVRSCHQPPTRNPSSKLISRTTAISTKTSGMGTESRSC